MEAWSCSPSQSLAGFFRFVFFVGNFKGFRLPCPRLRNFYGQTSTSLDLRLKQAWIGVEAGVCDFTTVVGTHGKLSISGIKVQAGDILPGDLLFAAEPGT